MKTFLIEEFFHLPSTAPVVHCELQISPRIFEKVQNGPYGAWGKLTHVENLKWKISWHL
jgi:hypothetical protein